MSFPAHINKDGIVQTVAQHCRNTAEIARKNLCRLGLADTAYLAGLLHDAGKCTDEFSNYIQKAALGEHVCRGSVIHTFAAVRFLLNTYHSAAEPEDDAIKNAAAEILSCAIGGHHGLFDCFDENKSCGFTHRIGKQPEYDDRAMQGFFKEISGRECIDGLFSSSVQEISSKIQQISAISKCAEEAQFYLALLTRLITSALIDADRSDTAAFMSPDECENGGSLTAEALKTVTEHFNSRLAGFECVTPIQTARSELSELCFRAASKPGGILRLNLPTGAGKTLSGLRYALRHAEVFGKERIFFISPLLSILEQNARAIRDALGDDSLVLEHHSDIIAGKLSDNELNRYELLCDSWNSPVVITTLVQFLNTLFSGKTASVRRFHSLANSVIVIDEVQTVPLKTLSLFNSAVNFLSETGNTTVVLCSATQPYLSGIPRPLSEGMDIIKSDAVKKYSAVFKRNSIIYKGKKRLEEIPLLISELFDKYESVLVVCNKKDQASALFDLTEDICANRYHLSAGMCTAHRKSVLSEIKERLKLKQRDKILCISTQVIEAGVDISFDAVIRLCAGLDSIVQAAGRCNRNGEGRPDAPVWIVDCCDENLTVLKDISDAKEATQSLIYSFEKEAGRFDSDLSSDKSVRFFYEKLYKAKNKDFFDFVKQGYPSVYSMLAENTRYTDTGKESKRFFLHQAFKTAGSLFEVFDQDQTSVVVPWGEGERIAQELISAREYVTKKAYDDAKPYTVSVFSYQLERLRECAAIISVGDGQDGQAFVLDKNYYSNNTGIIIPKKGEALCDTLIL